MKRVRSQLIRPGRRREIAELAEAVADEHCPAGQVEPLTVARAKGVTVSFGHYGEAFDGMLEWRLGRFHVYCNVDRTGPTEAPRTRFTLAHELGHYYLDEHRLALSGGRVEAHPSCCDYESPILAEQEADHFAANLLMPSARFAAAARGAAPGLEGVLSLAGRFGTSLTATAIRYAGANAAACAVIKWTWQGYAWKRLSSAAFQARFRRTVEAPRDLPPDCPTRLALARRQPPPAGYFEAGTTASTWFPRVGQGDLRDVIFIEQAIGLGQFGVLTLLYPQNAGVRPQRTHNHAD